MIVNSIFIPYSCRGNKEQILSAYRNVLAETLNNGIHGNGDLKKFIEREDAAFRAFLSGLHELGEANMADITRDTENAAPRCFSPLGARKSLTRTPRYTWPYVPTVG